MIKLINLDFKVSPVYSRLDFLTLLPRLRTFIVNQTAELPQKEAKSTLARLDEQCVPLLDDNEKMSAIVGCIDTEKPPFQAFWMQMVTTIKLNQTSLMTGQERALAVPGSIEMSAIYAVASALRAYQIGMAVYAAARYAHTKPIAQDKLGEYWLTVKV
jgi:hypothetical protein